MGDGMSWWIYLQRFGKTVKVKAHNEGGSLIFTSREHLRDHEKGYDRFDNHYAEMNITWNYGKHFDFHQLDGKKAKDTIALLQNAVSSLGTKCDLDYWKPTEGNVGHCCAVLLSWARQHSRATWELH